MASDYETIQNQKSMVETIQADLGLVRAFIENAQLAKDGGYTEHYERVKARAIRGVQTMRRFAEQVDSLIVKEEIRKRLRVLDDLISKL